MCPPQVLLWLQRSGLKKLPTFSLISENTAALRKQLQQFDSFQHDCEEQSVQVEELVATASGVEAEITGFRSDLGKKAESLGTVWGKFLQRVGNRGDVLTLALAFYSAIEQVGVSINIYDVHTCTFYMLLLHPPPPPPPVGAAKC